jgi:hypothetical protein
MGSELEYCFFFLKKIAVVFLDVLKMASASSSQRLTTRGGSSCGMLVVGLFFYLPSQNFPMRIWILDFPIHQKSLPIVYAWALPCV